LFDAVFYVLFDRVFYALFDAVLDTQLARMMRVLAGPFDTAFDSKPLDPSTSLQV